MKMMMMALGMGMKKKKNDNLGEDKFLRLKFLRVNN